MAQVGSAVGIDCGKGFLDVAGFPGGDRLRVTNSPEGIEDLLRWVRDRGHCNVGLEASGGYERPARDGLLKAGLNVRVFDPRRVRHFAKAKGRKAKNDTIDAGVIAEFTATFADAEVVEADWVREELAGLCGARALLVEKRADVVKVHAIAPDSAKPALQDAIDHLGQSIDRLDTEIGRLLAANPALAGKSEVLRTAPGIGKVTAVTLIALLPELGRTTAARISALVGVAPFDCDSGRHPVNDISPADEPASARLSTWRLWLRRRAVAVQ
jgi:transposase